MTSLAARQALGKVQLKTGTNFGGKWIGHGLILLNTKNQQTRLAVPPLDSTEPGNALVLAIRYPGFCFGKLDVA